MKVPKIMIEIREPNRKADVTEYRLGVDKVFITNGCLIFRIAPKEWKEFQQFYPIKFNPPIK